MKKKYLYIFLLLFITAFSVQAQTSKSTGPAEPSKAENTLERIQIYPNPVTTGKIYINSESNTSKEIDLYDMLGKKVLSTDMSGYQKEISLGTLKAGVYLLKVTEKSNSITRKIIIK